MSFYSVMRSSEELFLYSVMWCVEGLNAVWGAVGPLKCIEGSLVGIRTHTPKKHTHVNILFSCEEFVKSIFFIHSEHGQG